MIQEGAELVYDRLSHAAEDTGALIRESPPYTEEEILQWFEALSLEDRSRVVFFGWCAKRRFRLPIRFFPAGHDPIVQ